MPISPNSIPDQPEHIPHGAPMGPVTPTTPSQPFEPPTAGALKPQDWGPGWAQFQDFLKSPQNMAMFQKTLLSNMSNQIQQNQARYEANKQLIKELYGDDNR